MSIRRFQILALAVIISVPLLSQADPPLDSVRNLMINGAADEAIQALNRSIGSNSSSAEVHNLLCRVQYAEERWDSAIRECERAAQLSPNNGEYQLWLGRAYGEKADHSSWLTAIGLAKKSRAAFERAVQLSPSNIDARADLSEYYIEAPGFLGGGTDRAVAQANTIEKLDPVTALWIRARVAEHDKRAADAERVYKKAIQVTNNPPRLMLDLASFYRRFNRIDDAERTIAQAARLDAKNTSTLVDSASLLLRLGRNFPLAASLLRRYIDQGTRSEDAPLFRAQFLLGQVLEKSGDAAGARAAYQAAHANASGFEPAKVALKRLAS
jgi:tetratricopeptide (TPR) repeat protein